MRFLIRCDANKKNGFGHFSRQLNLSRYLQMAASDIEILFLGNYNEFALELLNEYGFIGHNIPPEDPFNGNTVTCMPQEYDAVITDSYLLDRNYIDELKAHREWTTIFFDDFHQLGFSGTDLVVNFTLEADRYDYASSHRARGLEYFIAKPELQEIKKKRSAIENFKRFLVFASAMEHAEEFYEVIHWLAKKHPDLEFLVVSNKDHGVGFGQGNVSWKLPVQEVEELYMWADAAICGGGLMKYECAYLAIPAAIISLNNGQAEETRSFSKAGLCFEAGVLGVHNPESIFRALDDFCTDDPLKQSLSENGTRKFANHSPFHLTELILDIVRHE